MKFLARSPRCFTIAVNWDERKNSAPWWRPSLSGVLPVGERCCRTKVMKSSLTKSRLLLDFLPKAAFTAVSSTFSTCTSSVSARDRKYAWGLAASHRGTRMRLCSPRATTSDLRRRVDRHYDSFIAALWQCPSNLCPIPRAVAMHLQRKVGHITSSLKHVWDLLCINQLPCGSKHSRTMMSFSLVLWYLRVTFMTERLSAPVSCAGRTAVCKPGTRSLQPAQMPECDCRTSSGPGVCGLIIEVNGLTSPRPCPGTRNRKIPA